MKQIYIAWIGFQRRPESMRRFFGFDVRYVENPFHSRLTKPLGYLMQARRTLGLLADESPEVVWLQSPPAFVVHLVLAYRRLTRRRFKLVADLHNAALRRPWSSFPFNTTALNRAEMVLVHNPHVMADALKLGIAAPRLKVLRDRVPELPIDAAAAVPEGTPVIVMPCSFHADEPLDAVLEAARLRPHIRFLITGNKRKADALGLPARAPGNVAFPGFLPTEDFDRLLLQAAGVLCLTTQDGIQLSAAAEALAAGKPMILSDTSLLRELFGPAGLFVDNSAVSIAAACQAAVSEHAEHAAASLALRQASEARWVAEAEELRRLLAA